MALPTFQAKGTLASASITSITVTWPAGNYTTGDIGLLLVETCGGESPTLTTPAGFVAIPDSPSSTGTTTNGTKLSVYWCRATSGSMTSPVIADAGNHTMGIIVVFRGCVAVGNPWDVTAAAQKASASTSCSWPAVTTSMNDCLIVNILSRDNDSAAAAASSVTNGSLSNLTERVDEGATDGNGGGFVLYEGGLALLGNSGSTSGTITSSINASITIALLPQTFVNTGWGYYNKVTVNNAKVDADLTDFPMYIDLADMGDAFWSKVQADGGDIRMTNSDRTTYLPVEIVSIDTSGKTGELWFQGDPLNSTDVDFYMFYGHATAEQPQEDAMHGRYNVWDANYTAVWHMNNDPSAGGACVLDSTSNQRHLTPTGTFVSGDVVTGAFRAYASGTAIHLDETSDYLIRTSEEMGQPAAMCIEGWAKKTNDAGQDEFISIADSIAIRINAPGFNMFYFRGSGWNGVDYSPTVNLAWHHFAFNVAAGAQEGFLDGASIGTATYAEAINWTDGQTSTTIGHHSSGAGYELNGNVDEVRASKVVRASTWISTQYNNMYDPATFYTIQSQRTLLDTMSASTQVMNPLRQRISKAPIGRSIPNIDVFVAPPFEAGMTESTSRQYSRDMRAIRQHPLFYQRDKDAIDTGINDHGDMEPAPERADYPPQLLSRNYFKHYLPRVTGAPDTFKSIPEAERESSAPAHVRLRKWKAVRSDHVMEVPEDSFVDIYEALLGSQGRTIRPRKNVQRDPEQNQPLDTFASFQLGEEYLGSQGRIVRKSPAPKGYAVPYFAEEVLTTEDGSGLSSSAPLRISRRGTVPRPYTDFQEESFVDLTEAIMGSLAPAFTRLARKNIRRDDQQSPKETFVALNEAFEVSTSIPYMVRPRRNTRGDNQMELPEDTFTSMVEAEGSRPSHLRTVRPRQNVRQDNVMEEPEDTFVSLVESVMGSMPPSFTRRAARKMIFDANQNPKDFFTQLNEELMGSRRIYTPPLRKAPRGAYSSDQLDPTEEQEEEGVNTTQMPPARRVRRVMTFSTDQISEEIFIDISTEVIGSSGYRRGVQKPVTRTSSSSVSDEIASPTFDETWNRPILPRPRVAQRAMIREWMNYGDVNILIYTAASRHRIRLIINDSEPDNRIAVEDSMSRDVLVAEDSQQRLRIVVDDQKSRQRLAPNDLRARERLDI